MIARERCSKIADLFGIAIAVIDPRADVIEQPDRRPDVACASGSSDPPERGHAKARVSALDSPGELRNFPRATPRGRSANADALRRALEVCVELDDDRDDPILETNTVPIAEVPDGRPAAPTSCRPRLRATRTTARSLRLPT